MKNFKMYPSTSNKIVDLIERNVGKYPADDHVTPNEALEGADYHKICSDWFNDDEEAMREWVRECVREIQGEMIMEGGTL